MRSTDARRRERDGPNGVRHGFQVSLYKVEPRLCVLARNLLSKDDCRAALVDEPMPHRPQVPLVIKPISFACRAERLAWAATGPDGAIIGPSSSPEGIGPDTNAGEEVALSKSMKVGWTDVSNISLIDFPVCNVAGLDEFAEPGGGLGVDFVIVGGPLPHVPDAPWWMVVLGGARRQNAECAAGNRPLDGNVRFALDIDDDYAAD